MTDIELNTTRASGNACRAIAALAALLTVALLTVPASVAAGTSDEPAVGSDAKCLNCHSRQLKKTLEDGEQLLLHVSLGEFADSAHSEIGCTGCHAAIAGRKHPSREPISSRRAYSLDQNEICRGCHAAKFKQYEGSIHARLVADGNLAAPLCTDCHSAHAVQPMAAYEPVTGLPCKNCHAAVYENYARSVHGKARTTGNVIRANHIQAPICADCHTAHEVTAAAYGDRIQAACLDCHDEARLAHKEWLPNAALHLDVVACAACHSPEAEHRINLELYDKRARVPVGQQDGYAGMSDRIRASEASDGNIDSLELWNLVREASRKGQAVDITLRGRMTVRNGIEAHQLAVKASAVRDCDRCHREGSEAFENVTVSITGPDGRKQYYAADSDVLNSAVSVDSVSDFYAMGATRIGLLDGLLIFGLVGGLAIPVAHVTLGRFLNGNRKLENNGGNDADNAH